MTLTIKSALTTQFRVIECRYKMAVRRKIYQSSLGMIQLSISLSIFLFSAFLFLFFNRPTDLFSRERGGGKFQLRC